MRRVTIVLLLIVISTALAGLAADWSRYLSMARIEAFVHSYGMWGVAASIGLMVVHSFIPFPAEFLAIANGMMYGPLWGIAITWVGAMLGAILAFALTRRFGRPFAERLISRRGWQSADAWTAVEGAKLLLLSRLFPVIAFNLINYAAGLTKISWWTFIWTTGLGILPLTALMVLMGDQFKDLPWWAWVAVLVGSAATWIFFRDRFNHAARGKSDRTSLDVGASAKQPPKGDT